MVYLESSIFSRKSKNKIYIIIVRGEQPIFHSSVLTYFSTLAPCHLVKIILCVCFMAIVNLEVPKNTANIIGPQLPRNFVVVMGDYHER